MGGGSNARVQKSPPGEIPRIHYRVDTVAESAQCFRGFLAVRGRFAKVLGDDLPSWPLCVSLPPGEDNTRRTASNVSDGRPPSLPFRYQSDKRCLSDDLSDAIRTTPLLFGTLV